MMTVIKMNEKELNEEENFVECLKSLTDEQIKDIYDRVWKPILGDKPITNKSGWRDVR